MKKECATNIYGKRNSYSMKRRLKKLKEGLKTLGTRRSSTLEGKYLLKYRGIRSWHGIFGCQPNSIRMKLDQS